jgi:hypothetical protein
MPAVHQDFVWRVAGGYAWVRSAVAEADAASRPRWTLAELLPARDAPPARTYRPFRDFSGLFLAFAETAPTLDGVLAFAERFGDLGRPCAIASGGTPLDEAGRPTRPVGEPFELWRQQISDMRQACDLWLMCRNVDMAALANHVRWERDDAGRDAVLYASHPGHDSGDITPAGYRAERQVIASPTWHPERLAEFAPGDLIRPALTYVQAAVNERSEGLASPRLVWDATGGGLALELVPHGLLGVLWLQLARAVSLGSGFRRCGQCATWFELSPTTARTNRLFCSGACRSKGHRARQARAVELHQQGRSYREIAKDVDSDAATIKKWIKEKK